MDGKTWLKSFILDGFILTILFFNMYYINGLLLQKKALEYHC